MITLKHNKGDTLVYLFQVQNEAGLPIDITGAKFYATIKSRYDTDASDTTAVFKKEWTSHTSPTQGKSQLTATAQEMQIQAGMYIMDIKMKTGTNTFTTMAIFQLEIVNIVTNRTT